MAAVYRASTTEPWVDCEIVGRHAAGLVLREVGPQLPGVFVAPLDNVRCATNVILNIRKWDGSWQREGR